MSESRTPLQQLTESQLTAAIEEVMADHNNWVDDDAWHKVILYLDGVANMYSFKNTNDFIGWLKA